MKKKYPSLKRTKLSSDISVLKAEIILQDSINADLRKQLEASEKEVDILNKSILSCENSLNSANIEIEIANEIIESLKSFIHKLKK